MYNSFNDLNVPMLCINKRGNKLLALVTGY